MIIFRLVEDRAINIKQLRYFVKVAETGNITRASEKLNVAQSALGQQVRQLEELLGVQLFVRRYQLNSQSGFAA